ncbi:class I SAM-dependent methyltransferase [Candidatus Roizmanbacteria bacterium]|nr:class I SAM-dependent methyltransferase [Candidatus Roizmanbacteria bacterium]
MRKIQKDTTFEENYFEGYYQGIGDFSFKRNIELTNWFKGMVHYINQFYPLKKGRGKKLIEFGCATGAAANLLADCGFKVTSTDISNYAVKLAKKTYPDIFFIQHDVQKLFIKDNNFDVAVAFDVVEHLKTPEVAIKNIYKILKKGGVMILTTPNDYKHMSNDPTHINVKRPNEWKKIIKNTGFSKISINQVTFIPYLYRFHWRLNYPLPLAVESPYFISPVVIVAQK